MDPVILSPPPTSNVQLDGDLRAYSRTRHLHPSGKSSERANLTLARAKISDCQDAFNIPSSVCSVSPPTENIPKMIISLNLHQSLVVGGKKNTTSWHFPLEPVNIRHSFLEGAPTGNLFSSSAVAPNSPNCKTCCNKCKPADRRKRTYYMKDEIIMQVNYSPLMIFNATFLETSRA